MCLFYVPFRSRSESFIHATNTDSRYVILINNSRYTVNEGAHPPNMLINGTNKWQLICAVDSQKAVLRYGGPHKNFRLYTRKQQLATTIVSDNQVMMSNLGVFETIDSRGIRDESSSLASFMSTV